MKTISNLLNEYDDILSQCCPWIERDISIEFFVSGDIRLLSPMREEDRADGWYDGDNQFTNWGDCRDFIKQEIRRLMRD